MTDAKVPLLIEPTLGFHNRKLGPRPVPITRAFPYYTTRHRRRNAPIYVHRVRSGLLHFHKAWQLGGSPRTAGDGTHISWRLWCGTSGSSHSGALFPNPLAVTDDRGITVVVCATCEARALANGYDSSLTAPDVPPIMFRPRGPRAGLEVST